MTINHLAILATRKEIKQQCDKDTVYSNAHRTVVIDCATPNATF